MQKAQEALKQQSQESQSSTELPVGHYFILLHFTLINLADEVLNVFCLFQELLQKLKEAEENHASIQAECEQYRTVLAETVSASKYSVYSTNLTFHIWKII